MKLGASSGPSRLGGVGLMVASLLAQQQVIWEADFSALTAGAITDPAGATITRASTAYDVHPIVATKTTGAYATDAARVVDTIDGDTVLMWEASTKNDHTAEDASTWSSGGSVGSTTTNDGTTPDVAGAASSSKWAILSNGYGRQDSVGNYYPTDVPGDEITVSHYVRGSGTYGPNFYDGALAHSTFATLAGDGSWEFFSTSYMSAARTKSILVADGRDQSANGGTTAGARNYNSCRHMMERSVRASSWYTPGGTRAADVHGGVAAANVIRNGRLHLEVSFVALYTSIGARRLPHDHVIWANSAGDYAAIDAYARALRVYVGGVLYWVKAPILWTYRDRITLRLDVGNGPTTGSITVGAGRTMAINDGRDLPALPSSGTYYFATDASGARQFEAGHRWWRVYDRSPSYRTIVVSTTAELLAALATAGASTRIQLRGGRYEVSAEIVLTAQNNGLAICSYPGETAVLDGGEIVSGTWTPADGSNVRTIAFSGHSRQLWVGTTACVRARSSADPAGWTWVGDGTVIAPSSGEAAKVGLDGEIIARRDWRMFRCRVASIVGATITLNAADYANATTLAAGFSPNAVWWAEGLGYVGDAEGYFWHDRANDTLHVNEGSGLDLDTDQVIAGKIQRLFCVQGTLGATANDITISGVELRHTTWTDPDDNGASHLQGSFLVRTGAGDDGSDYLKIPAMIMTEAADAFLITGSVIAGHGGDGVSFRAGSVRCAVLDCTVDDIAATGLSMGSVTRYVLDPHPTDVREEITDCVFANNTLTSIARDYRSAHGIWFATAARPIIARNKITDTPYTPIAFGWGWGAWDLGGVDYMGSPSGWPLGVTPAPTEETHAGDGLIIANYLDGYLLDLDDGGGIYSIGDQGNGGRTKITLNYVKATSSAANQSGLYFDQGSEDEDANRNVLDGQAAGSGLWAKLQASVTPHAVANDVIGNRIDAGGYSAGAGNRQAGNAVGTLDATALAIKAAAGPIAA